MAITIDSISHGGAITQFENINFSTAKQKYSLGKESRFPNLNNKILNE